MRVGIVTIHHVNNYGAVFQAFALARALRAMGATVEVVDYRPEVAVQLYRQPIWRNGRPNPRGFLWQRRFERFIAGCLPLSAYRYDSINDLRERENKYDVLIAGSDQIWCIGEGSSRGYDPVFFLDFWHDPAVRRFSYAASAGNTESFGVHEAQIRTSLRGFEAISVRDDRTAQLIGELTGRVPVTVLDPVFLHDFHEITASDRLSNELVVFSSRPERIEQMARRLAKRHGLRIVALVHKCRWADVEDRVPSPDKWLRRIAGARAVFTDYFHGVALSLRFGVPVVADAPSGKTNKILDLMDKAGVSSLFLEHGHAEDAAENALSLLQHYRGDVQTCLAAHENRSLAFLQRVMAAREQAVGTS